MSERKDFSVYPEAYEEVKALLDFLPEDDKIRDTYMEGLIRQLINL